MSTAKQGDNVKVHYKGMLDDGTEFDSSTGKDPIDFTIGEHKVIAGFEDGVVGLAIGTLVMLGPLPVGDCPWVVMPVNEAR